MMEKEKTEITPFRMNQLIKMASDLNNKMVNNIYGITFEEMEIVLALLQEAIRQSRD